MRFLNPYGRVKFRGVTLNRRTRAMIRSAERKAGFRFPLAQGSYNGGGVAASAGTHDGGGAVDVGAATLNQHQKAVVLKCMKLVGFAAWYRPNVPGLWGPHIHAEAFGDREMSVGGKQQLVAFDARKDGLVGNRVDNSFRPRRKRKWSWRKKRPVQRR